MNTIIGLRTDTSAYYMPGRTPLLVGLIAGLGQTDFEPVVEGIGNNLTSIRNRVNWLADKIGCNPAKVASKKTGLPDLYHLVGNNLPYFKRTPIIFSYEDLGAFAEKGSGRGDYPLVRRIQLNKVFANAERIVTPGPYLAQRIPEDKFKLENIEIIKPGAPIWSYAPVSAVDGISPKLQWVNYATEIKEYFVSIAERSNWANIVYQLRGFARASEEYPIKLVIIVNSDSLRFVCKSIKRIEEEYPGLSQRIGVCLHVSPPLKSSIIANSIGLISPTLLDGGCSDAIGALKLGTPVVGSALSAYQDLLETTDSTKLSSSMGFERARGTGTFITSDLRSNINSDNAALELVDVFNPVSIESGIVKLYLASRADTKKAALKLGENFDWKRCAEQYVKIYESVLQEC